MSNALELAAVAVDVSQLDTAKPLAEIFQPFQTVLEKWEAKAAALVVTDLSQRTEMQQAKLARIELKNTRVAMDKERLRLVSGLKDRTSKIDGIARVIRVKIEELEESLRASEEFAARHAEKAKADLKAKREAEFSPFGDVAIIRDLSDLSEAEYAKALSDVKLLRQAQQEAAAKAEADRLAKEAAERAERERIAAEKAAEKAAAAPDKTKVTLFAGTLRDMARLKLNDELLSDAIWTKVNELADWCEATAEKQ